MATIIPRQAAIIPLSSSKVERSHNVQFIGKAGTDLGGHRAVKKDSFNLVQYASSDNILDVGKVLGITLGASLTGSSISIVREGEIEEPSWNWLLDMPIFLSSNGQLTQVVPSYPTYAFSQILAFPITPTRILVTIREPILLV